MAVLYIRDKDDNFVPIPSIRGEKGKSAYEQAKDSGYKGTEEEFIAILNGLVDLEGVARIETGSYTGVQEINGETSESTTLSFDIAPEIVILSDDIGCTFGIAFRGIDAMLIIDSASQIILQSLNSPIVTFGENSITWKSVYEGTYWQFDKIGCRYYYKAIGKVVS